MFFSRNTSKSFYTRLKDIFLLNISFVISCIPIFTIGTAITAMYSVFFNLEDDTRIIPAYVQEFKSNFKQSVLVWLLLLVFAVIIFLDYMLIDLLEIGYVLLTIVLYIDIFLVVGISTYAFGLIAMFNNSIKQLLKNAFLLSISMPIKTLFMVLVTILPLILMYLSYDLIPTVIVLWTLFGCAICGEINADKLKDIFASFPTEDQD